MVDITCIVSGVIAAGPDDDINFVSVVPLTKLSVSPLWMTDCELDITDPELLSINVEYKCVLLLCSVEAEDSSSKELVPVPSTGDCTSSEAVDDQIVSFELKTPDCHCVVSVIMPDVCLFDRNKDSVPKADPDISLFCGTVVDEKLDSSKNSEYTLEGYKSVKLIVLMSLVRDSNAVSV